jgi:hypothetical protein
MAKPQKATKEADKRAKIFISFMNNTYKKLHSDAQRTLKTGLGVESGKDPEYYEKFPKVTFSMNRGKTKLQSPLHKAIGLSAGRTSVCWSAHMVDKARHINTHVNGETCNQAPKQMRLLGIYHDEYRINWVKGLKKSRLRNYGNKLYWAENDPPHVELPNSKVADFGNPLVQECLDHYARLTRKEGKKKNTNFERDYARALKTHVEKYEE